MTGLARWLGGATILLSVLAGAPAGAEDSRSPFLKKQDHKRAQALHDEAQSLYDRGEYRVAIKKLEAALALDPEGKELVYNLALIHERLAEMDVAEAYYRRYLTMETDPKVREKVSGILKRIEGAKREVAQKAKAHDAERPGAIPPLAALAPPPPAAQPEEPPSRFTPAVIIVSGAAAAALLVSGGFGIAAIADNPGRSAKTGNGVSVADLEAKATSAHRDAIVCDITFVVGAALGAVGVYLYASGKPEAARRTPPGTSARPAFVQVAF